MVITLIGYRGTGKTSIAAPLAERLGWNWIDADVELERRDGRTIAQIFADGGEAEFRDLERKLLAELLTEDQLVLAAGGGAILNELTRRDMADAGPVVWLRASVDTIDQRLGSDETTPSRRPNLTSGGRQEIAELLKQREPLYQSCATLTVDTDSSPIGEIVEQIVSAVQIR